MLCGAQTYNDWNTTTFSNGDSVNISYDALSSNKNGNILKSSINLTSGTLNANIDARSGMRQCGLVACLSNQTTFGSKGTNLNFTVISGNITGTPAAFDIQNNGSLTVESNIKVNASGTIPSGIFRAQGSSNLTFNGNVELSGPSAAITMGSGNLTINQGGGKKVAITGAISSSGGTTNIKLDSNDDSINGAISANGGNTTLNLSGGSQIAGSFTGNGTSNLTLTVDNSTFGGSVTNSGGTNNVTINGGGKIQGKLTTSGTSLTLNMDNGSISQGVSSTASTNTISLTNNSTITSGGLSASGSTNSLMINGTGATITGNVSLTANNGGNNKTSLTKANIAGDLTLSGANQGSITINNSTIGGTVSTNQEANFGTITSSNIGKMSHTNGAFTATLSGSTITDGITATSNGNAISLTLQSNSRLNGSSSLNADGAKNTVSINGNSTAGDISLTSTLAAENANKLTMTGGSIGNLTLSAGSAEKSNSLNINNATIQSVNQTSGGMSFLLSNSSSVTEGIHTSATSAKVDIAAIDNSRINGTSELGGADEVRVVFKGTAGAGTLNFSGNTNNLISRGNAATSITAVTMQNTGTNQVLTETNAVLTLGSLSMSGRTNEIAETDGGTALQRDGANLTITGNASVTAANGGHNELAFGKGNITGSLTTSGETDIYMLNDYHIKKGVIHNDGDFNADLYSTSQISQGIQTSGTGTSIINLKNDSKLNGNSNLATTTNTVDLINASSINGDTTFTGNTNTLTLNDTSSITGNTSFSNTSTLTANNGTTITGQVITAGGTATYTFGGNGAGTTGATVTGGIDTNQGAAKTTANFTDSSILQNGTSTFHSGIDITFANNSKAINETFNIQAGTANIKFQDSAEMQSGSINNNGGIANIIFTDDAQMNAQGGATATINTNSGTTNLTANSSADLAGNLNQSGGAFNATFSENSTLTGDATQSGGTSNITFQDQAKWTGNFTQRNAGSNSTITFHNTANMEGNITTYDGTTNITFNNGTKIKGNIAAQGKDNRVTFDTATLDGDLTLDGFGDIMGHSKGDFTNSTITGNVQGYDQVELNLTKTHIGGYIHQGPSANNSGITGNFEDSQILGGFAGTNSINKLNITHSNIQNGVTQSGASLKMSATTTTISGGFSGTNNSQNTIDMTKGSLAGGISQNTGSLDFTSNQTAITGGFHGSVDSTNTMIMTGGSLEGGISQNTGTLSLEADSVSISGGFTGIDSNNTMLLMGGDFNNGDITQTQGSLDGDIIGTTNLGNFSGTSSRNNIQLANSIIKNIEQSAGSLTLSTDSDVNGHIQGTNNSTNNITLRGSNVTGDITQNTGALSLQAYNTNAKEISVIGNALGDASFTLLADTTTATKMSLENSISTGTANDFHLTDTFSQTNGKSSLVFSNTTFEQDSTIIFNRKQQNNNPDNAILNFSNSTLQSFSVDATRASGSIDTKIDASLTLSNSKMKDFSGSGAKGNYSLILSSQSSTQAISQNMGSLLISASSKSTIHGDITISGFATPTISLSNSTAEKNIYNKTSGDMSISAIDSKIKGDIEQQAGGALSLSLTDTIIGGHYKQFEGQSTLNSMNSKINNGIDLKNFTGEANMRFDQASKVSNGLKSENTTTNFDLLGGSTIEGTNPTNAITQIAGELRGNLNRVSGIVGDISFKNGISSLYLYGKSYIKGDITANQNTTTILIDDSVIEGSININQGQGNPTGESFALIAQNGSTIQGSAGNGNPSQVNIKNADFALTLDTGSTFNGNITQENNKQTIIVKQNSNLNGNITNTDVTSSISVNNATIGGNISQTRGTLALDLSNNGKVMGNISLISANTTLSGTGTGNQIGGNFSQENGHLGGSMTGLTLVGTFSQNGGNSNVGFFNSEFKSNTTITSAISSSLTFDNSTLKGYATSGGLNNTLKLLNNSIMNGTLTLTNGALTTLTMENSTLNGENNIAINASDASFLTFNTKNSTINGDVRANTGGVRGNTDNTDITGDISLTDTISDVSFTNTSTITGNLTATGANSNNTINFDNSSVTGSVSQTGGAINLDLSNSSAIGQNLTFTNATAKLTGSGAGNSIGGNFDSNNTTLTGDASGLNLKGTFTQTQGSSDIIFRNDSLFEGKVTLDQGDSNISFIDNSGIRNAIEIKNQTNALVGLQGNSFITGNISVTNTTSATISAQNNSTITGDITLNDSTTNLNLSNQSSLQGAITQTAGTFNISASGRSTLTSNMTLKNGTTSISLSDGSNLTGTITAENNPLSFTLRDNSSYNSLNAPQDISVTNADLTITASNNSVFGGNLTHTSNNGNNHSANLTFNSNSFYSGTMEFKDITVSAKFNQSGIFSDNIEITGKSALFDFDGATNGGVIQHLTANGTDLSINTTNQSHITINDLQIIGNTLNLKATNSSRLTANVTLNNQTTATYTANTNGNLNVNTKIANQASTLTVDINGGMMQGAITQDMGNNGFPNGVITLNNAGRWAVTDDTQAKELTLTNTEEQLYSDAIFASAFNSPLSFVDFTLDFADEDTTSRVGKAIIQKPQPQPNQPIPPAPDGSTYVRQLHLNEIKGNNGLFRVYADLGTNLADNILASKASGDHLIQVQYRAETFREIGGDRIVVAKVTDPSTTVSFKGTQSEIGLTKYDTEILKENAQDGQGFEWIIGQATPAGMSYSSKIIASILQSQYRTFAIEIDSLDRRMGDLEFIKRDKGFWIRSFIGSNTKEATDYSTLATDNYYSIWSGFDYNSIGLTVHNYVGVFFNYTGINTESKDYTGKSSNIAFGFYNTFKAFSGFYADILAKYIYTMSEFDISNYSLAKNSPKIDNHKFLLNAEIGYSFYYGEKGKSGYIQPQFQVTSGYIHKTDLSVVDVSGETINATIGRNFPVSIRAGAFWGQVFGEKIKSHIKLGTSFVYDVDSGGVLNFSDSSTELQFKQGSDFRWVLSAATDFTFSEFFKLYASFDTSFFGNYNTTYSANLGIRFTFGRANNYVRNIPMVYNPYTPPVSIDDDKRTVPVVKRYTTKDIDQNYVGKPRRVESYIQGNSNPTIQQGSPTYTPSRRSHRDITSEVEF